MAVANLTVQPGFPDNEFGATPAQVSILLSSAQAGASSKWTPQMKSQALAAIKPMRDTASKALDSVDARRIVIRNRKASLSTQIASLQTGNSALPQFVSACQPFVSASQQGLDAGTALVEANELVYGDISELAYQLGLLPDLDNALIAEQQGIKNAINFLDQLAVILEGQP